MSQSEYKSTPEIGTPLYKDQSFMQGGLYRARGVPLYYEALNKKMSLNHAKASMHAGMDDHVSRIY